VLSKADLRQLPTLGDPSASVLVLEFGDFECPYCRQHAATTMAEISDKFVRTGKVRYVFAQFPLDEHKEARLLAAAARCAHLQGKFWPMHDTLFRGQEPADAAALQQLAAQMGLSPADFGRCLQDSSTSTEINAEKHLGERLGVQGTPWFVIGRGGDGHWSDVTQAFGARPFEFFDHAISGLLEASRPKVQPEGAIAASAPSTAQ
jgi:protein-disulfide isomerase